MKHQYDLSQLNWQLCGWAPDLWRLQRTMEIGALPDCDVNALPAKVPGSVQYTLREAGLIPDWNVGMNYRDCEWVENRDWIYEAKIPDEWIEQGKTYRLNCLGLDYCGSIFLNGQLVSTFAGSHVPHVFDLTPFLVETGNVLRIIFELSPRWLGQYNFTSRIKEWKTRFHYTWDWTVRLVQVGIWDSVFLEVTDGREICDFQCATDADLATSTGALKVSGRALADDARVSLKLSRDGKTVREEEISAGLFTTVGFSWRDLPVDLWWTNMEGDQPLYDLECSMVGASGSVIDSVTRRVGFRNISWVACEGAPTEADPWICRINDRPIFLQGIDWTPILPNYADVTDDDYRKRLVQYRDLGLNILRVWGGAFQEKEIFYNLCDELGILVWQEFPLSSSGVCNLPPTDEKAVEDMAKIAATYIAKRQHHASLALWCGGNELQKPVDDGRPCGGEPVKATPEFPLIHRLKQVVEQLDPSRRFLPTSPCGPRFSAEPPEFGKGVHWCVHGPWKPEADLERWKWYWNNDDSLFRSETGSPGASSVEIIRKSLGDCSETPIARNNPFWKRTSPWWLEDYEFQFDKGRSPETLEEYVEWSQNRQAVALTTAVKACKDRYPRCGGIILWMGHDCYPCTANTAIIDFDGEPKPAALALKEIWRAKPVNG